MRVVVVGAGLAGLVAADELAARRRGGGRARGAVACRRARVVAAAAERRGRGDGRRVHPPRQHGDPRAGRPVRARALGQGHAVRAARPARRHRHHPRGAGGRDARRWRRRSRAVRRRAPSAEAFLDSIDIPAGAREAILARVEISCANTADQVAAADLAGRRAHRRRAVAEHRGRQPAAAARAGRGARRRRCTWTRPVHAIAVGAGARARRVDRRRASRPTRAVIAVPASVLGGIAFEPALPDAVRDALGLVRYGHAAKLFVPLRAPAPPSAVMNVARALLDLDRHRRRRRAAARRERVRRLEARARRARRGGRARAAGSTRSSGLRADLDLDLAGAVLSTWDDDPWVRAAYSTSPPPEVAEAVERPTGPLAFAGEHTAGRVRRADGGRDQERAARRALAASRGDVAVDLRHLRGHVGPVEASARARRPRPPAGRAARRR